MGGALQQTDQPGVNRGGFYEKSDRQVREQQTSAYEHYQITQKNILPRSHVVGSGMVGGARNSVGSLSREQEKL